MILILSGPGDAHADAVEGHLTSRGAAFLRFDSADFPSRASLSMTLDCGGSFAGSLTANSCSVGLESITSIWVRRPGRPESRAPHLGAAAHAQVVADSAAVLDDLWTTLPTFRLPAAPALITAAAHKSEQLRRGALLGFDIPHTWTGNSPNDLLETICARTGRFVTKRTAPSQRMTDERGDEISRLTTVLRPADLTHVDGVALCPLTVQEAICKAFELRVTVVGTRVFAAAIYSQLSNHARDDWRNFDPVHTPIETYELPDEIVAACVGLVASYGLSYGAIDLIMTPEGRLVFLELNPNGQYLWVEQGTGHPISAAIAELLDTASTDRSTADELEGPVVHHVA